MPRRLGAYQADRGAERRAETFCSRPFVILISDQTSSLDFPPRGRSLPLTFTPPSSPLLLCFHRLLSLLTPTICLTSRRGNTPTLRTLHCSDFPTTTLSVREKVLLMQSSAQYSDWVGWHLPRIESRCQGGGSQDLLCTLQADLKCCEEKDEKER